MHLLFISSLLPDDRPATGFEIATRAIVDSYREQNVRLSFAGFQRPESAAARTDEIWLGRIRIENATASPARKAAWVAAALARGLPVSAAKLKLHSQQAIQARLADAGPVDGFILNSVQMPAAYPFLTRTKPSIFIAHNVENLSALQNAGNAVSGPQRLLYLREARLLRRIEARICREAALVHTLSAADREGLGLGAAANCLPMALTVGRAPIADEGERSHDVGLIGTWSWAPNRVGLDWFVSHVMPLLPHHLSVAVAGRFDGPPPPAPPNLRYLGMVDDAQRFLAASRVVALATRGGTGVQLKTIETFEEGMPAVVTSQALRGVDALPHNVRVADDPRAFADALVAMVADERAGLIARTDGSDFAFSQKRALNTAVRDGLAIFEAVLARRSEPERGERPVKPGPLLARGSVAARG